jgi:CheY-like chemotaxis protein
MSTSTGMNRNQPHLPEGILANRGVLVVEDDQDARDLLITVLRTNGAKVAAADSFQTAIEVLKQFIPDVLVLDIGLPEYNGYALIAKIRSQPLTRQIPAIAVTAFASPTDRDTALASGFQAHISKPFDPENLVRVIMQLVLTRHRTA